MSRTKQPARVEPTPLRPTPQIQLPHLHEMQETVFLDPARFKVVVCGRQWGKTVLGAVMCVAEAAKGGDVWWVAPSFPIGELGWRILEKLSRQIPGTRFEGRPVFRITLPTGGSIQLRSADNPDSLRGATLSGVVFDEAAQAKADAWPTLEPTLAVKRGWATFISTPKGTNWFHDLFVDAGALPEWARFSFPSSTSPYIGEESLQQARLRHSALWFSQEYGAEFISAGEAFFRYDWIRRYTLEPSDAGPIYLLGGERVALDTCTRFHTVDLAWSTAEDADYTVIASWALTPRKHLILLEVVRGHFEGPDIVPRMRTAYERWGGHLAVERATRQMSIIQEAVRTGLPVREIRADKDKVARSLPAQARMEQGTVWFPQTSTPWYPPLEEELMAFPAARHDDFVDTLSYAVLEAARVDPRGVVWV